MYKGFLFFSILVILFFYCKSHINQESNDIETPFEIIEAYSQKKYSGVLNGNNSIDYTIILNLKTEKKIEFRNLTINKKQIEFYKIDSNIINDKNILGTIILHATEIMERNKVENINPVYKISYIYQNNNQDKTIDTIVQKKPIFQP